MTPAARKLAALPLARCLWGIGDPVDEAFHWCGQRVEAGKAYCAAHAEEAREREPGKAKAA
jgi:hypothetical protein